MRVLPRILLHIAIFAVISPCALAEHRALWEWGAGLGYIHAPFYRGAKQTKDYFIPIPFARLRGEVFAADEDGVRGRLLNNKRLKLDISIAGSVPVPEDTKGARIGMPSLDPTGELGPSLEYQLWKHATKGHSIRLELPVRAVFSIGEPLLAHQGWAASPLIGWIQKYRNKGVLWRMKLSTGPLFADSKYNNYFYQVKPEYSTEQRPSYNATGGYTGSRVTFSISRNTSSTYFGVFARYDALQNAVFSDSPLVETNDFAIIGIAAVWIISNSEARAKHW